MATAREGGPLPTDWPAHVREGVARRSAPSLRPVLNATGVILHTNLGRAPLAPSAVSAIESVGQGYSTLEYDVVSGQRGSRLSHGSDLLANLTGAETALTMNNAAGALVLLLNVLASGREVIISRGELIEIGGAFRIPDILASSGAILKEVGTTNRTHLSDYDEAIGPDTGAILVVHRSNFEQKGFVATPKPASIAQLAVSHGIPSIYDAGSGLLIDVSDLGLTSEPVISSAVGWGFDAVVFSGDKLLGGPQAGCIVGRNALLSRAGKHPLARALRVDKLTLAGLEATLALYRDPATARATVPVLRMLCKNEAELKTEAEALAGAIPRSFQPDLVSGQSAVGGGAFPDATLPTTLVSLDPAPLLAERLAERLRQGEPPLVVRISENRVLLDPRTLPADSTSIVARALQAALEP